MIEELVLTEKIETLIPLAYIISFAIAYYGPNAEILGRVKLDLWQNKPVLDFGNHMKSVFILFVIDLMSLVVNGILLRTACNINIFKIFQNIQSEFWLIMAAQQAVLIARVIKFITQSKYSVLHAFGGKGFLFLGCLDSPSSTEKKVLGGLWATFKGSFFSCFRGQTMFYNFFLNFFAPENMKTMGKFRAAQILKFECMEGILMQDWVFRLGFIIYI